MRVERPEIGVLDDIAGVVPVGEAIGQSRQVNDDSDDGNRRSKYPQAAAIRKSSRVHRSHLTQGAVSAGSSPGSTRSSQPPHTTVTLFPEQQEALDAHYSRFVVGRSLCSSAAPMPIDLLPTLVGQAGGIVQLLRGLLVLPELVEQESKPCVRHSRVRADAQDLAEGPYGAFVVALRRQ
jgi:hypothetical protein